MVTIFAFPLGLGIYPIAELPLEIYHGEHRAEYTTELHRKNLVQLCAKIPLAVWLQYLRSPLAEGVYSVACAKSSIKSSTSSIPTLNLINESLNPFFILSSRGMDACVMDAG